jgi:hypothetical protein
MKEKILIIILLTKSISNRSSINQSASEKIKNHHNLKIIKSSVRIFGPKGKNFCIISDIKLKDNYLFQLIIAKTSIF